MARMARVAAPACRTPSPSAATGGPTCSGPTPVFGFLPFNPQSALRNPQCFSPFPIPGRGPFAVAVVVPRSAFRVPRFFALRPHNSFARLGLQKERARGACNPLSRLDLQKQMSPGFRFPVPCPPFPAFGSYPQRRMAIRPCHKPLKSGQNRSKRGQNRVKKGQKTRANRHAHLNILGGHPLWR